MRFATALISAVLGLAASATALANDTGFAQSTHPTRRESGKLCIVGHTHGGSGTGGTKSVALIAAIKAFVDTTVAEYGSDWAKWAKAGNKSVKYEKTAEGWTAHAEGRPCK